MEKQTFKRNVAYKFKIASLLAGKPIMDLDKLKSVEIDGREVIRTNLIANVVDKYVQDGEKKFASITLDDASGQIKAKVFGEEISKFSDLNQGDTILIIGLLRFWNNEIYLTPEIIKKKEPSYLLIRKLEIESAMPKSINKEQILELRDKMLKMIKDAEKEGGVDIEKLIMELKESPDIINQEIKRLLEDGMIYEPRPGKIRYLG